MSSALEGIAKEISNSTGIQQEISPELGGKVERCLADSGLPGEISKRFLSFVTKVNAPTVANAISGWCKTGFLGFDADDWKAWNYRNKSAHGNFALLGSSFDERKLSVPKRDRLANMINKLVMYAIGYEGKYLDYATHSEQEFPPGPPHLNWLKFV